MDREDRERWRGKGSSSINPFPRAPKPPTLYTLVYPKPDSHWEREGRIKNFDQPGRPAKSPLSVPRTWERQTGTETAGGRGRQTARLVHIARAYTDCVSWGVRTIKIWLSGKISGCSATYHPDGICFLRTRWRGPIWLTWQPAVSGDYGPIWWAQLRWRLLVHGGGSRVCGQLSLHIWWTNLHRKKSHFR